MTQNSKEFVQPNASKSTPVPNTITSTRGNNGSTATPENSNSTSEKATSMKHNGDILLNNFQIKKNRYRVLLNYDHIVWERLDAKKSQSVEISNTKEAEYESEQLEKRAAYGITSNVVHIEEIIKVCKGDKKSATTHDKTLTPPTSTNHSGPPSRSIDHANATTVRSPPPPTEQFLTIHYAERIVKSPADCNRWHMRVLTLYNADPYIICRWHNLLTIMLRKMSRVQRLLVFINPYGGRRQGLQTYERHCKPLFQLAGIDASCIISQRSNQIRDILLSHDLTPYDAVCCVGGDGTVAEVINGLIFRSIRDMGVKEPTSPPYIPKPIMPIAIIPAGSTDTVAYSLHGTSDVRTAAIHLILGQRRGMDICSVSNREGLIRFCASLLSYGYLGDVAAKSEKYRWMGTKRYEYTGVKTFLHNNGYEAELRIQLAEEESEAIDSGATSIDRRSEDTLCQANCQRCSTASDFYGEPMSKPTSSTSLNGTKEEKHKSEVPQPSLAKLTQPVNILGSLEDNNNLLSQNGVEDHHLDPSSSQLPKDNDDISRNLNKMDCDNVKAVTLRPDLENNALLIHNSNDRAIDDQRATKSVGNPPSLSASDSSMNCQSNADDESSPQPSSSNSGLNIDESNEKWKVIKGKFFMISGANITCACSRSPNGVSRYSHLGDGTLDLILVRKTSLLNNVRLLINTMGRNGDIRNLPFVEVYRTKKFYFRTPYTNSDDDYSISGSCQPITTSSSNGNDNDHVSNWNCDGEVVYDLEVIMRSHCQLIDVFMRGPHNYSKPQHPGSGTTKSLFCCCNCED